MADSSERAAQGAKTMREGIGAINPELEKLTAGYLDEMRVLTKRGASYDEIQRVEQRYKEELKAFGDAHGLTATEVQKLVEEQNILKGAIAAGVTPLNDYGAALKNAKPSLQQLREEQERLRKETESGNASYLHWKEGMDFVRVTAGQTTEAVEALRAKMAEAAAIAGKTEDYDKWKLSVESMRKAAADAAATAGNLTGNLNGMASAQGQCNDAFGQGIGVQGTVKIMMLQVQQATAEETQALKDQLTAINALSDAQNKMLDVATGWKDYLVTLTENYKSGTSSLLVYIQSLNDFAMQLRTLFAGAQGAAKDAIQNMIDMIQKLVATAGSVTPNTNTGYGGALNNLFNKP
jgi:chromosome segregation ATPase